MNSVKSNAVYAQSIELSKEVYRRVFLKLTMFMASVSCLALCAYYY